MATLVINAGAFLRYRIRTSTRQRKRTRRAIRHAMRTQAHRPAYVAKMLRKARNG